VSRSQQIGLVLLLIGFVLFVLYRLGG